MSTNSSPDIAEDAQGQSASRGFLPNKMGRIVLLALEEVVGSEGRDTILTMARMQDRLDHYPPKNLAKEFSFDELARMQQALEERVAYVPGVHFYPNQDGGFHAMRLNFSYCRKR